MLRRKKRTRRLRGKKRNYEGDRPGDRRGQEKGKGMMEKRGGRE